MLDEASWQEIETVPITELRSHPRNYRDHPDDQVEHVMASIRENGIYRNIVVARDGTILAGHGVVKALSRMGIEEVPVFRLPLDPEDPRALKVLVGDNEITKLGGVDDRRLTELLKQVRDETREGLPGTGYDDRMLANLVFVTRPEGEVENFDAAMHWVGLPEYESERPLRKLILNFRSEEDREEFVRVAGINNVRKKKTIWSASHPFESFQDPSSLHFGN